MSKEKLAHLEMIQDVINRLSQNSFLLKGWTVVLLSGLFGLAAADSDAAFVYVAYVPASFFWVLDAYFLRQERLFRALYDDVRSRPNDEVDFSMDTSAVASNVHPASRVAMSITLAWFYGATLATVLFVTVMAR